jgi:S-adenosylhomocysteine hydrolase
LTGFFPKLPLLEEVCQNFAPPRIRLDRTVIVCVQHLLETTGSLFECLVDLGVRPAHLFALGKLYSSCAEVESSLKRGGIQVIDHSRINQLGRYDEALEADARRMWQFVLRSIDWKKIQHLVVLDDGGFGIAGMPEIPPHVSIVGIEQTMSGLASMRFGGSRPIPVIEVASSAAKKYIEPPMICDATFAKLAIPLFAQNAGATFGVVGLGNIGRAIANGLLQRKAKVTVFDGDRDRMAAVNGTVGCHSVQDVFERSDVIFGCTGRDIVGSSGWWTRLQGRKLLVSCSSQDREFASILRNLKLRPSSPVDDIHVALERGELLVARGGFPANFDGSRESVPSDDIQMTRSLLLAAVLQALFPVRRESGREMLDAEFQRFVVSRWAKLQPHRSVWYAPGLLEKFTAIDWIEKNSGGNIRREAYLTAEASGSAVRH